MPTASWDGAAETAASTAETAASWDGAAERAAETAAEKHEHAQCTPPDKHEFNEALTQGG